MTPLSGRGQLVRVGRVAGAEALMSLLVKTWQRRKRFPEVSMPVLVQPGATATTDLELHRK